MKRFLLALSACATALHAEDVTLEWVARGFSQKQGYYKPQRAELTPEKPSHVARLPDGLGEALFGVIPFGPAAEDRKIAVLLEEGNGRPGKSRLWLDANGNGDFTDDPAPSWTSRTSQAGEQTLISWSGRAVLPVKHGDVSREAGLEFYRFDPEDPKRPAFRTTLFYYRDFGLAGKVTLGEKTWDALLSDDKARGDFAASEDVRLSLDLNGDGKFDARSEGFASKEPFNLGGTTYELAGLQPGGRFQIVKSARTAAERVVPAVLKAGSSVKAFEDQSISGAAIRFPGDYQGKVVLLDFWATWCRPCVAELPHLKKVHAEFQAQGFEVLGVSLEDERTLPGLAAFVEENGMTWPQIADGKGWNARLAALYGVRSIPACFLVDGTTGLLVATSTELRGEALRGTVEKALGNRDRAPAPATVAVAGAKGEGEAGKTAAAPTPDSPLVRRARELVEAGKLPGAEAFLEAQRTPASAPVELAPPQAGALPGRAIASRARSSYVRVGWFYQCTKCSRWHTNLAGGYAIAKDTVVSAHHVLEKPPETMKSGQGYPVVIRGEDEVFGVAGVVVSSVAADTIILRVDATDLVPLGLGGEVEPGDRVYCLSDPRGVRGYFSTGIVNRRYAKSGNQTGDPVDQRLHVSTDWAQGSSGAALLDDSGNAVGHVSTIRTLFGEKQGNAGTVPSVMSLREAIPVSCVRHLLGEPAALTGAGPANR